MSANNPNERRDALVCRHMPANNPNRNRDALVCRHMSEDVTLVGR